MADRTLLKSLMSLYQDSEKFREQVVCGYFGLTDVRLGHGRLNKKKSVFIIYSVLNNKRDWFEAELFIEKLAGQYESFNLSENDVDQMVNKMEEAGLILFSVTFPKKILLAEYYRSIIFGAP